LSADGKNFINFSKGETYKAIKHVRITVGKKLLKKADKIDDKKEKRNLLNKHKFFIRDLVIN